VLITAGPTIEYIDPLRVITNQSTGMTGVLLARVSKKELESEARKKMKECKADLMVANDVGSSRYRKNPENNEVLIVDSKKVQASGWKTKQKIAKFIRKEIERRIV